MRNIAIITSIILTGIVGWLIFMPRSSNPEPVVLPNITSQPSPDSIPVPKSSIPIKTTTNSIPSKPRPNPQTTPTPAPTTPIDTTKYYTSAEVSTHASTQSCWSSINGKVYDLTSWINQHPGGASAIKRLCGVDGSEDFNDQHGGQARPERELAAFYIGTLK